MFIGLISVEVKVIYVVQTQTFTSIWLNFAFATIF